MPLIEPGQKAPAFTLNDQHAVAHRLSAYAGRPVVLYFYPKDDTPGCTKEACSFRDSYEAFKEAGAEVIGVSSDSTASHGKFASKSKANGTFSIKVRVTKNGKTKDHCRKHVTWQVS